MARMPVRCLEERLVGMGSGDFLKRSLSVTAISGKGDFSIDGPFTEVNVSGKIPDVTSATHPASEETVARGRPRDEERTTAILDATRDLMRTGGWDDFRIQDVAKAAGCGLATIYRRWDTKEELVAAAMAARPLPDIEFTGDPETDLRAVLWEWADELHEKGEAMFGFLAATRTDPLLRAAMDDSILGTARAVLLDLIGALMGDSPHVETVLDASIGLLMVRDGLMGGTTPEQYVDDVLGLIHALAAR